MHLLLLTQLCCTPTCLATPTSPSARCTGVLPSLQRALLHHNRSLLRPLGTSAMTHTADAVGTPSFGCGGAKDVQQQADALPPHHVPNPTWLGPKFRNVWGDYKLVSFSEAMEWQRNQPKGVNAMSVGHLIGKPKAAREDFR